MRQLQLRHHMWLNVRHDSSPTKKNYFSGKSAHLRLQLSVPYRPLTTEGPQALTGPRSG